MKNITLAAVFAVAALPAFSGSLSDPVVEPAVIEADTVSSSDDILVPIFALLLFGAAVLK